MTEATPPTPPIELDLARIEAAMARLVEAAFLDEAAFVAEHGVTPAQAYSAAASNIGRVILAPVNTSVRYGFDVLLSHLTNLVGPDAAKTVCDRAEAEGRRRVKERMPQGSQPAARRRQSKSAPPPPTSEARH